MVTPALSYPGVYVQEVPSGVRTIVGVGTSIGMFIGTARKDPSTNQFVAPVIQTSRAPSEKTLRADNWFVTSGSSSVILDQRAKRV